jgi:hypothetical protein
MIQLFEIMPPTTKRLIHRMVQSKYGRLKAHVIENKLMNTFHSWYLSEYRCTTDPGSVEKEQTFEKSKLEPSTRDNLD